MANFKVIGVIDGDTFEVSPEGKWNGQTGSRVRPAGYDAPELHEHGGEAARAKLSRLISGEQVDLQAAYKIDHGRLVCEVYHRNRNLKDYFPDYQ